MKKRIEEAIIGLAVGDALGVPVEFDSRESLKRNPVIDMREYGTHYQPKGTWSDDTSMAIALMDAVIDDDGELNYYDIMDNFCSWIKEAKYTATDEFFDIGGCVRNAILNYCDGDEPLSCGPDGEFDCGNGALMRIIPMLFWCEKKYGDDFIFNTEARKKIEDVTKLTHGFSRCILANGIYLSIANEILKGKEKEEAVSDGLSKAKLAYSTDPIYASEFDKFKLLFDKDLKNASEVLIKSTGYVVDTLTASIWCLLTTDSYKECVLKAVNLGDDTDTTGAVVGALAGMYYKEEGIPKEWIRDTLKSDYLRELSRKFGESLGI